MKKLVKVKVKVLQKWNKGITKSKKYKEKSEWKYRTMKCEDN